MPAQVAFNTIPQLFTRLADHYDGAQHTALRHKANDTWVNIPWERLQDEVHAVAGYLASEGVMPGDRVALLSENRPEWAITDLATQILGGVNVSIYTSLPPAKVGYILRDAGAETLVVSVPVQRKKVESIFEACPDLKRVVVMDALPDDPPDWMTAWAEARATGAEYWRAHTDALEQRARDVTPDDTSALIYTSGTTGEPKGVILTHRNFCSNVKAALQRVPFNDDDHHLSFLPLCHAFERTAGFTAVLSAGGTISYAESIEAVSQNLLETKPTVMISVPRMFEKVYNRVTKQASEGSALQQSVFDWAVRIGKRYAAARRPGAWLRAQYKLAHTLVFSKLHEKLGGNLKFAVSGGAALPKEIGTFFQAAGVTIIEGYGLTETAPVMAVNPLEEPRYGTVGHVLPGVEVGIMDLESEALIGTQHGDDYPSALTTAEGEIVVKGPNVMSGYWKRPEETRAAFDSDGWYHTGDVGRFDDGYLMVTDRIKHMIVSRGGKNIYPGPIEDQFKTKGWIDQIVVIGEDRPFLTALVVPDLETLRMHVRDAEDAEVAVSDEALLTDPAVERLAKETFNAFNHDAAAHEKIRNYHLLATPFTVEEGTLTPTMKLKRAAIEEQYADAIDAMYAKFERFG
ncbi:AMP-dependent synthetase/ligase [Salisaeta longa]|uniref:AMP-dependent synthetase/ligase n=1 Tax=Salisaeta longa TaxID=503170 RepID=UPI0003B4B3AB|nr:long-chain fatty acid--CoA ligase [Salisaeta longa]